ncbi:O-antigen ligase family protein [Actinomycetospora sp. NBRC 106378]|uniref:O-antigen ligase family protein n=1 Tax=Actinomycetospora sp. NBRC 106378 TaxID=3032208 RepID=UPI002556A1FE|nr:O-antigen ligase family protein [Actinomycetospora sp. NBRC 106378]
MEAGVLAAIAVVAALLVVGVLLADGRGLVPLTRSVPVVVATAVVLGVVAVRGIEDLGVGLLLLAALTATWNGLSSIGLSVAQPALAGALVVLAAVAVALRRPVHVPGWVWVLPAVLVLVAVLAWFFPPSPGYLATRVLVPVPDSVAAETPPFALANVVNLVRWLVSAAALPVAACLAIAARPRLAPVLAVTAAVGATVNAAVAVTDELGLTAISARLVPIVDVGGRQAGLSIQPNHLALAIAVAVPVVTWRVLVASTPARRVGWLVVGTVLAAGLATSASRAGLVSALLGAALTVLALRAGRRLVLPLVGGVVALAVVAVAAFPALLDRVAEQLRLSGADSADESNAIRAGIARQAFTDFAHSPLHGLGLPVAADAHDVYLQLLASGGVLLLVGFGVFVLGFVLEVRSLESPGPGSGDPDDGLPRVLLVAVVSWLLVGAVVNQLTDAFLYLPVAIVAGLAAARASAVPHAGGPA